MDLWEETIATPLGRILLVTHGSLVCSLDFDGFQTRLKRLLNRRFGSYRLIPHPGSSQALKLIDAYFKGDLYALSKMSLDSRGTPFQESVWSALTQIPAGTTATYKDIAGSIGKSRAYRAVGMANRSNPIALALPCHRVIGADGNLGGYAGGVEKKSWLIQHERKWT